MAESKRADAHRKANMDTFEAYGKGRSWESAFRNLNQAIELIYLMCELESSVVFVEHAERVFSEASQDFKELKLRISDQLLFQSYIEESPGEDIDNLSIAWDVPSFKLDYSRHLPDEAATPGCSELLQSDRFIARGSSPLAPFPGKQMNEENRVDSDVRAASTGALIDEKEPLRMRRPRATSETACLDTYSPEAHPGPRLAARHLRPRLNSSPQSTGDAQCSPGTTSGGATARRGNSAVATPGGRSLHHKLMSPERFKRDPAETRRVADEKQQRAERLRSGLEAERKAKLEKAKQEREAVRSLQGELQQVRQQEQRARHALSQERRKVLLHGIVARATDESEKVKEVQFIRQLEADSSRAALEARLERGGVRRREKLAMRQLRNGREVDFVLEDAQRRKQAREQARMEELFEKLQKKEEAIAKLEVERRKGRTTPATDGDSATSNPQSTLESPAADGSTTSATETPKQRRERLELERAQERHTALEKRLQEAAERRTQMLNATRNAATAASAATTTPTPVATSSAPLHTDSNASKNGATQFNTNALNGDPQRRRTAAGDGTHAKQSKAQTTDTSSHVQRETWAGRVLRSRGVKGGESAKSSAMYNHILKSLRTKASKLRKRLSVDPCSNEEAFSSLAGCDGTAKKCDGDESPVSSLAIDSVVAPAGCSSDTSLLHHYSHLATAVSTAVDSQSPKALMHALAAIGHVSTWPVNPPEPPCNMSSPTAYATRASYTSTLQTQQYCSLAQSSGLLRTVAEALVSTATCCQVQKHSADSSTHVWPAETVVAAATTLVGLTQSPESRIATLNFPCIVGLVDSIRIHLDSAIECINPCPQSTRSNGREGVKSSSSQSQDAHKSAPQHTAAVSCMVVLIHLLQCYPQSQETRCRRCDVISYALAAGLVYRIAHFFLLMHGSMGEAAVVPAAVRHSMQLLELLTAADPRAVLSAARRSRGVGDGMVCLRVKSIRANLLTMARDTSLMGLLSLLSASLLPAATASSRGPTAMIERPPDDPQHPIVSRLAVTELLPDELLPSALSALRTINGMLLLALEEMQTLLTAPDLSAELLFVLALVLSLCSARWPGDDGVVALLLHEAVLLLGLYSSGSPEHQHKLCWGPAPSLLQRLCAVPPQYLHTTHGCGKCMDAPQPPATTRETVESHVFLEAAQRSFVAEHAAADTTLPAQCHPTPNSAPIPHNGSASNLMSRTSCALSESDTVETEYDKSVSVSATDGNGAPTTGSHPAPQVPITCGAVRTEASNTKSEDPNNRSSTVSALRSVACGHQHPICEQRHSNSSQCTCASVQEQGNTEKQRNTAHSGSQAPLYLQHVLYPTLLASCMDAPRNFQAVIDAIGSQGILDYCTAHAPPPMSPHFTAAGTSSLGSPRPFPPQWPPHTHHHYANQYHPAAVPSTSESPRSLSASDAAQRMSQQLDPVPAHLNSNPRNCPQTASVATAADTAASSAAGPNSGAASVGDVSHISQMTMQVCYPEWHVDLGPLDGRFHPQYRIQASSWWRAYDQLLAAAGYSGNSTGAYVHDVSIATYHPT